ncbi:hypothetical protein VP1G_02759 [Cytospora mali]|uniref:RanBD1 domain-containing protein n=1 Tax=Cytospora mali TaxID=578113 RepID=A0A194UUT3_CYTMA|nr:hypothetical protein VP1G_02759 [Valsa mali var. pyri (nom. inval.)]
MDSSTRQRGPSFSFRAGQSSSFPTSTFSSKLRHEVHDDVASRGSSRPLGSWRTTGPSSRAQPAASTVMAGRRIFDRNQNLSKLGLSTSRSAPNVPANTPGKIFNRPGLTNGNAPKFHFSPRIPANTMRESFPAVTPGRSFRGSTADINGRAMSKTPGSNLFSMRIASPPPELDGEELAKQVPNNPNRVGSVYADEYLSHLVPPELDDLQRRQFLCILDLRRLKYAATEIFAKKDWRVNIINFGKEYEKSRSLIMLRYGLYEFKTVPASREVLQKWKQENNVPDEDDEMDEAPAPKSNGASSKFRASTKRRADDDLTKDSDTIASRVSSKRRATDREPLTESSAMTSNAGATPFVKKSKRGAELADEVDENLPSKKKSSTLSIFEDVTNNSPSKPAASPTKPPAKNIFAQPAQTSSILGGGLKAPSSGNIFGHLSEQNSPEGSDNEEGSEAESDDDVEEVSAAQPAAPTTTSSLFGVKPSAAFTSESSTTGSALSKGPSLFDRVTKGTDGEAVRNTAEDKPAAQQPPTGIFASAKRPASPGAESQPQNKTWNPNTPIKFGAKASQPGPSLFGTGTTESSSIFASKPAENTGFKLGSTETPKAGGASLFGTQVQDFAKQKEAPKPAAPSLFGQASKPSEPSTSLFGNTSKTPLFGQKAEEPNPADSTVPPTTPSLFGAQSNAASTTPFGKPTDTPSTQAETKSIFAGLNTPATTTQTPAPSLFGTTTDKPGSLLFGAKSDDKPSATPAYGGFGTQSSSASSLFGAKSPAIEEKKEESAPKRKKPDSDEAGAVFGSGSTDQPSKKFSFGGGAPTSAASLPPKTAAAANGADDAGSIFGAASQEGAKTYSFGSTASTTPAPTTPKPVEAPAPSSLFGNATSQPEVAKTQPSIFANSTAPSTGFSFGAGTSNTPSSNLFGGASNNNNTTDSNQPSGFSFGSGGAPASNSFTFNSGGDQGSFKNPFASGTNASATPSFDFGNTQSQSANAPFQFGGPSSSTIPPTSSFTFGGASQPATSGPASNSFTFGGDSQPSNNASAPSSNMFGGSQPNGASSIFSFGSQAQSQPAPAAGNMFSGQPANAAQGIFASNLAPPAGSSTGTNTPLFGGASSIATTPANGTPEPEAAASKKDNADEKTADEDGKPQEQISLTEGGPGEEDEEVVHEVRAKALRLVQSKADEDDKTASKKSNSSWKTEGLGPLRVLKHKATGAVRILLRAEPRGNVAMNKLVLPDFDYKVDKGAKWVKVACAKDDGKGLETWMLQVKTNEFAVKLAGALEENKKANKK